MLTLFAAILGAIQGSTMRHILFLSCITFALAGCAAPYSPNIYASNAVQLANKVEAGTVIGYRQVAISANGTIGTVTGGAAGGVLGAEYANSALIAVGATAVGSILGNALDHATGDTTGWEYILRKPTGDMLSVTQREQKPLALGQKVLVIMGPQARVVPDYSMAPEPVVMAAVEEKKPETVAKTEPVKVEVVLSLPPGVSVQQAAAVKPPEPAVEESPVSASNDVPTLDALLAELVDLSPIVASGSDVAARPACADETADGCTQTSEP